MTDDAIFLLQAGALTPLQETPYPKEDILQKVLEDYPSLIAGMATAGGAGRLLLIRREMGVPGAGGSAGLSLDHLFVDDSAVPVLVEVKRSSDTRARREVVAQMLDYAANGVVHWPLDQLRAHVAAQALSRGLDEAQLLQAELAVDDPDAFWRLVEENLRRGRVRCVFLADRLTPGLVRIIEFLNAQMRDTEVLGVELPQFTGPGQAVVYVPRVIGKTADAIATKQSRTGVQWDRASFREYAQQHGTTAEVAFLDALLQHREAHPGGRFSWGTGATPGVTGWYVVAGEQTPVWNVNLGAGAGAGSFYFIFKEYIARHPARATSHAAAVRAVPGLAAKVDAAEQNDWKSWVGMPLTQAAASRDAVLAAVDDTVA